MAAFDNRLIQVVFTYGENQLTVDQGIYISANGKKYANALQDECSLSLGNLSRNHRNELLTQLTPWNLDQQRKTVAVYAGRESTGMFLLYQGDITRASPTQPPNIDLQVTSKTAQFYKYDLIAQSQAITAPLSQIAQQAATSMGLAVQFEATDRPVQNFSYTGSKVGQVEAIGACGVDCFIDGTTLVVKDSGVALSNATHVLSSSTGMIGQPEPTEYGVNVSSFLSPTTKIGGSLSLTSTQNPLLNGDYTIYQLGFSIASRENPFYTIIDASKYPILYGNANLPQVPQ